MVLVRLLVMQLLGVWVGVVSASAVLSSSTLPEYLVAGFILLGASSVVVSTTRVLYRSVAVLYEED